MRFGGGLIRRAAESARRGLARQGRSYGGTAPVASICAHKGVLACLHAFFYLLVHSCMCARSIGVPGSVSVYMIIRAPQAKCLREGIVLLLWAQMRRALPGF